MPELPQTPDTHDDFQERLAAALKRPQQRKEGGPAASTEPQPEAAASAGPVGQGDYAVKQGDCICSIAKQTGHLWETIWNDPANSELKEVREDPNVLLPGDRVTIPEKLVKQEPGETEARHRFKRQGEPSRLCLVVKSNGEPMANQPFSIRIDGQEISGATDSAGKLDVAIPGDASSAKLTIGSDPESQRVYKLRLGAVDPINLGTGVQARLKNLGFSCGSEKGDIGSQTLAALNRFREAAGLPTSDRLDEATLQELKEAHDHGKPLSKKGS